MNFIGIMELSRKNGGGDKRLIDQRSKIGAVWPMGISIAQSWFELGALTWLIGKYKIKSFVEIGIMQGGLSAQLFGWTVFAEDFRYLGIENEMGALDLKVRAAADQFENFDIWEVDAFETETISTIQSWIKKREGPTLIYCDDGNKPKELEIYSEIIRFGDLIAAHDFGHEYYESDLPEDENLQRIKSEWLIDTHIVAFEKARN